MTAVPGLGELARTIGAVVYVHVDGDHVGATEVTGDTDGATVGHGEAVEHPTQLLDVGGGVEVAVLGPRGFLSNPSLPASHGPTCTGNVGMPWAAYRSARANGSLLLRGRHRRASSIIISRASRNSSRSPSPLPRADHGRRRTGGRSCLAASWPMIPATWVPARHVGTVPPSAAKPGLGYDSRYRTDWRRLRSASPGLRRGSLAWWLHAASPPRTAVTAGGSDDGGGSKATRSVGTTGTPEAGSCGR